MVEIIPYTEDDEDSSTWIPLSAPAQQEAVANSRTPSIETNRQNLLSNSSPTAAAITSRRSSSNDSLPWSWQSQIISHLTSTPVREHESGDVSENDQEIEWRHADELTNDDKLFFRRSTAASTSRYGSDISLSTAQSTAGSSSNNNNFNRERHATPAQPNSSQPAASQQNQQLTTYRKQAKHKLQQTLIYHPMRSLPFLFIRHLYYETRHEFYIAWSAYTESNGVIFAPLTFYVIVLTLGMALILLGMYKIFSVAIVTALQFVISLIRFMVWGAVGVSTRLAVLSLTFVVVLGVLIWIFIIKARKARDIISINNEEEAPWTPDFATLIPVVVALMSTSMYELVAILYSIQALSLSVNGSNDLQQECTAVTMSVWSSVTAFVMAALVIVLTSVGVSAFATYLEGKVNETHMVEGTKSDGMLLVDMYLARIKRHLNACHTLSVAILAISAAAYLITRGIYLYFGGNVLNILSGLGSIGFHLVCIGVGMALVQWAGKLAMNELPSNDQGQNIYQRIARIALKESIIDITTNAVWSNVSGLSGVLSEEDGILRLAVLEWLVDRWTSSGSAEQQPQTSDTQSSGQEQTSSESTSEQKAEDGKAQSNNEQTSSSTHKSQTTSSHQDSTTPNINMDILKALPSYQSLEQVIAKLDADEALIPAIDSYRTWIYSLPPSRNVAMAVSCWKMCPGMVALLLVVAWSAITLLRELVLRLVYSHLLSDQCEALYTSNGLIWSTTLMLSPLLYLEYLRIRRWWSRVSCNIDGAQGDDPTNLVPDSLAIMLEYDYDKSSDSVTSTMKLSALNKLILQTWNVLLESIALLESAIPAVRCATVACAAANLTNDAACLVDLAVEIKNHGLLAGIGMLVVDAFSHHLQEELRRRHEENNEDTSANHRASPDIDLGGKYTSSLIKSVGHASKIVHNLSRLRQDKNGPKESADEPGRDRTGPSEANPDASGNINNDDSKAASPSAPEDPLNASEDSADSNDELNTHEENTISTGDDNSHENATVKHANRSGGDLVAPVDGVESDAESEDTPWCVTAAEYMPPHDQCEQTETLTAVAPEEDKKEDGGLPIWLGGGLAVVGAVVGGLAVAAASGGKKDEHKKERRGSSD